MAGRPTPIPTQFLASKLKNALPRGRYIRSDGGLCPGRSCRRREHHPVVGPAVTVREHAADRMIAVHVDAHGAAIPKFVADVEIHTFSQNKLSLAVHLDGFPDLAFHRPR